MTEAEFQNESAEDPRHLGSSTRKVATVQPSSLDPGGRVGDYILEYQVASGGMGIVYRARQISMRRFVALKVLRRNLSDNPGYMERFFREVRLLAQMEHPNIVQVIEAGIDRGISFFSMEFIEGCDLKAQIDAHHEFSEQETIRIARAVASALGYAWKRFKMIHRDVKPANIILDKVGMVKLLDLGISKQMLESTNITATNTSALVGSPYYISPEQARNESDLDFRADIYSLGVTMFHLLAGRPPYESKSSVEVVTMHFNSPVPNIRTFRPDVSPRLAALILKMMNKKRDYRHSSWQDLIDELDETAMALSTASKRPQRVPARNLFSRRMRPHRIVALFILFLLILTAFFTTIYIQARRAAEERSKPPQPSEPEFFSEPAAPSSDGFISPEELAARKEAIQAYEQRRKQQLSAIEQSSHQLELDRSYTEALSLWKQFKPDPEFEKDEVLLGRIQSQILYLEKQIQAQASGLEE